jgi:hypothetical protein
MSEEYHGSSAALAAAIFRQAGLTAKFWQQESGTCSAQL